MLVKSMLFGVLVAALLFLSLGGVYAQTIVREPYTISVSPTQSWTSTGLTITTGDSLIVYAIGAWDADLENYAWDGWTGPEGHGRGWPLTTQPCSTCPVMSLIGKIGDNSPFFVGRFRYFRADTDGILCFACNDEDDFDNSGVMTAFIWKIHNPRWAHEVVATIDIDPDTLNLWSRGKWITCYIELPDEYDVNDIDIATVYLNRTVLAESRPHEVDDYDDDGIADLMVKFDRTQVGSMLTPGNSIDILVVGEVGNEMFEGTDTIAVIMGGPQMAIEIPKPLPTTFLSAQNYPNPFTSATTISYALPKSSHVTLNVYNAAGQLVSTLVDQELGAGYYTAEWDRTGRFGNRVPSGIYSYRLQAGDFTSTKKMILLR